MFERYVTEKVKIEKEIADEIEVFTKESVLQSGLSDFTKNYIIRHSDETKISEDVYSQIEKAVKLRFNYAIRPKWTLLNFLFGKLESRPPQEVTARLGVFPFYKFYKDAVTNFISDNSPVFITNIQVADIIDDTNELIYEKLIDNISNIKIKNFFLQLFKLKYEYDHEINLDSSIPFLFVKIFLQDKSFDDQLKKFDELSDTNDETEINLKDIIKILTGKYSKVKNTEGVSKALPIEIDLESDRKEYESTPDISSVNSEMLIHDDEEKTGKVIVSDEELRSEESGENEKEELSEIETISDTKLEDIESMNSIKKLFTGSELEKILDKVYLSNKILRHRSFEELDNMDTWDDAIFHLSDIFERNDVDIYDKDVVMFVDVLNEYFKKIIDNTSHNL